MHSILFLKRYVTNIFINIKKQLLLILDREDDIYHECFKEIIDILSATLYHIENVYYKYFLYPKLQKIYQTSNTSNTSNDKIK